MVLSVTLNAKVFQVQEAEHPPSFLAPSDPAAAAAASGHLPSFHPAQRSASSTPLSALGVEGKINKRVAKGWFGRSEVAVGFRGVVDGHSRSSTAPAIFKAM